MLGFFACGITATSQLPREVNKSVLAYVKSFKRVNFRQYFVGMRERILLQRINVKLKFAIEYSSGYLRGTTYLWTLFSGPFRV